MHVQRIFAATPVAMMATSQKSKEHFVGKIVCILEGVNLVLKTKTR